MRTSTVYAALQGTYLDARELSMHIFEPILRSQDTEQFDLAHWICDILYRFRPRERNVCIPGIPQSVIMFKAAVAVPPVAIRGSRTKTKSTGGDGGNFE